MISRILVLLLIGLPAHVFAEPYIYPGHVEFSTQANPSRNALALRLVATVPSIPGNIVIDSIERGDGLIQVYASIVFGPSQSFGEEIHPLLLEDIDQTHVRIEFHARPYYQRTTDEYTLIDVVQVTYVPSTAVVPSNPSVFDAVSVVTAAAPGCGPVLSSHVDSAFDPQDGIDIVLPGSYTHTVWLSYAQWPCPAGGETDPEPVRVALAPTESSNSLLEGFHTVRFVHGGGGDAPYPPPDTRVLSFLVGSNLPSRIAGTWFNENHPGQGVQIQVIPQGQVLASWYTFDDAGTPAVIIAQGPSSGQSAELDAVILTGGQFPTVATTTGVPQPWGTLELEFIDCNNAIMTWDADRAGFADGTLALQRLSAQQDAECNAPSDLTGGAWQVIDPVPADPA